MRKISVISLLFISFLCLQAQNDVILTIGNEKINQSEFERVYLKNNKPTTPDKKSISEYLDLYVNFRLKVLEAKSKGLDTLESFRSELMGYRDQLAKPYLNDTTILENFYKEAYEHMKKEISCSFILVRLNPDPPAKDTLRAYKKAMRLRDLIVKKGVSFDKVAVDSSEDQYAKFNKGNFGYAAAFRYAYPIEKAVYATRIGQVSMPIRTKWGYFLARPNAERPARGDVRVAHIMAMVPEGSDQMKADSARIKIFDVYDQLKKGGNFEELAKKYSDDRFSAGMGGQLPMFHTGQMVEQFEDTAYTLKNIGDISSPCRTSYGWHIIKLLEKKPLASYAEMRKLIKDQLSRDERITSASEVMANNLKKQYGFKEDRSKLTPFYTLVDSTIYRNDWNPEKADNMKGVMFTIGTHQVVQSDFAHFIVEPKNRQSINNIEVLVDDCYKRFVTDQVLAYYKEQLPSINQDFRNIMNEYFDGILLFNITDQMVWSKAIKDTLGLQAYYEDVKTKYMWKDRINASIFTCKDKKIAEQVQKLLKKDKANILTKDQIAAKVCPKDTTHSCVGFKAGTYEKGENAMLDGIKWESGVSDIITKDSTFVIVVCKSVIPAEPKKLNEARGFIIADYQTYLEGKWIAELRNKYPVTVNKELLKQLEDKYKK